MGKTRFLTDNEKKHGISYLVQFQALNGIGYNFLGETTVYLLAILYGASNVQLGYLSSAVFLSGLILPLIPRFIVGKNLVNVLSMSWIFRGLVCLGYLGLYFLEGQQAVYLILAVYTLFAVVRTVGVIMFRPIMRMLSTSSNQGSIVGRTDFANQGASIVSRGISFFVTSFERLSGMTGLIALQVLGVIINTLAGIRFRKIPCRETVQYRQGKGVLDQLKLGLKNKRLRRILMLQWISISILVLSNLSIPFVRNRMSFQTSEVFLYSMGITVSSVLASMFVRTFSDSIGSKPLIKLSMSLTFLFSLMWVIMPEHLIKPFYYVAGFLIMFTVQMTRMLVGRLMISSMPEEDTIGFNSMVDFVIAGISLILGIVGGGLIDFGPTASAAFFNQYSLTFALGAALCLAGLIIALRVEDRGSMTGKEAAALLLSIDGLRAFIDISKLHNTDDPRLKRTVLISIGRNRNNTATGEIRRMLQSPFSSEKAEMIRSLFYYPRQSLGQLLREDAIDDDSFTQLDSIFALGSYPGPETEAVLLRLLESDSRRVKASAAKSLGRIGHKASLQLIRNLAESEREVRNSMNYIIALNSMDDEGIYLERTFFPTVDRRSRKFRQGMYSLLADLLQMQPELSDIYRRINSRQKDPLRDFLNCTRDSHDFLTAYAELGEWFSSQRFSEIIAFCRTLSVNTEPKGIGRYLRKAVFNLTDDLLKGSIPPTPEPGDFPAPEESAESCQPPALSDAFDLHDAVALVYFCYQMLKTE